MVRYWESGLKFLIAGGSLPWSLFLYRTQIQDQGGRGETPSNIDMAAAVATAVADETRG